MGGDDELGDEPQPEPEPEPAAAVVETYGSGGVIDSPTVNSFVVGVTIVEGSGDPQQAGEG